MNLAPTSPQGTMGFALMSKQEGMDFSVPKQGFGHAESREIGLRCYNTEVVLCFTGRNLPLLFTWGLD